MIFPRKECIFEINSHKKEQSAGLSLFNDNVQR